MNGELLSLIDAIVRDKGIDREVLIQAIESAMASAAKKGTGSESKEVTVTIDRQQGSITVMSDGQRLSSAEFSRIGAQTAKQVIMQKIREAERDVILGEFQDKAGTIVSGVVHRFERGDIIVDLGRTEAILPKSERIPYEEYHQGDQVQAYVLEARKGIKGAEILLSRAHDGFIRGLFALEVPEIGDGTVEIKALAREPGDRAKIAVWSKDEKVDCVGACVGVRGTRVKNIVRELHGERVDIIRWHDDINAYLAAALAPAQIAEIQADPATRQALVLVEDDQLSLAIGKKGQNVRLASKLTGWQLEIKSKAQLGAAAMPLRDVRGVGPTMEERLKGGGITAVQQLADATVEQLTAIKGIGDKTAEKLIEAAKEAVQAAQAKAQEAAAPEHPPAQSEPSSASESHEPQSGTSEQ
ncbi:MAG: transcription termination/antitermination protein NusA [Candidatus Omnitrophica bacterium]|nr:transcription termination/antitermination protein NusA [Candidatus Omnitrophota bacterium]